MDYGLPCDEAGGGPGGTLTSPSVGINRVATRYDAINETAAQDPPHRPLHKPSDVQGLPANWYVVHTLQADRSSGLRVLIENENPVVTARPEPRMLGMF